MFTVNEAIEKLVFVSSLDWTFLLMYLINNCQQCRRLKRFHPIFLFNLLRIHLCEIFFTLFQHHCFCQQI